MLKNNTVALAKSAKVFKIPTTITTVETEGFSGHTYPELLEVFPDNPLLERTSMNSWDDQKVRDALAQNGQKKIVVSIVTCMGISIKSHGTARSRCPTKEHSGVHLGARASLCDDYVDANS